MTCLICTIDDDLASGFFNREEYIEKTYKNSGRMADVKIAMLDKLGMNFENRFDQKDQLN